MLDSSNPPSGRGVTFVPSLRVLVADDHEIVRNGIRALIEREPDWKVVAEAADGRNAVAKTRELKPDMVVLDISMPLLNGLEAARQILKADPRTKILILSMHDSDSVIRDVLESGVLGYVSKSDASRDLVTAINAVRNNRPFFSPRVAQIALESYLQTGLGLAGREAPQSRLTPRQREIVQLLAEGKSSKEVALALGLSVKTAETHRANIMKRLNCHSVSELVRYAVKNDIILA